jgi:hypothetical protein
MGKGKKKKLAINRETVRQLHGNDLRKVMGGLAASDNTDLCTDGCTDLCNPPPVGSPPPVGPPVPHPKPTNGCHDVTG